VPDTPRSRDAAAVAESWGSDARFEDDTDTALNVALAQARAAGGPLIVCGSLYLVGHVRTVLLGRG
jgi:folylpolyglutamate synthase/dihydropteroate synthase